MTERGVRPQEDTHPHRKEIMENLRIKTCLRKNRNLALVNGLVGPAILAVPMGNSVSSYVGDNQVGDCGLSFLRCFQLLANFSLTYTQILLQFSCRFISLFCW